MPILFCLTGFFASCQDSVWGRSVSDLITMLAARDYRFLDGISPERYSEALKLGLSAPWYLALHLEEAGRTAEAGAFYELGARQSPYPFNHLCLKGLLGTGPVENRLAALEVLDVQKSFVTEGLDTGGIRDEILLEGGRFDELSGGLPVWSYAHPLPEALVKPASSLPAGYSEPFYRITEARAAVVQKDYQAAWARVQALLADPAPEILNRPVLSDFGRAALYGAGDLALAAESFANLVDENPAGEAEREKSYIAAFYAGRMYARAGNSHTRLARTYLAKAVSLADQPVDRDAALWYLLELSLKGNTSRFIADLGRYAPGWGDGASFSDLLDGLLARLVQERDWQSLLALQKALPDGAERDILVRIDYLAARSGLLSPDEADAALRSAFEGDHGSLYYHVLAGELLGLTPGSMAGPGSAGGKAADAVGQGAEIDVQSADGEVQTAEVDRRAVLEPVLRGFLRFGLPRRAYPFALANYPDLPVDLAKELADELSAKGLHSDALRLSILAIRSSDSPITDGDLAYIYPRPWLAEVSRASERFGVPEYLLYALIRTESYFQADAVSSAGASGLTQLMESTAGDVARRLKLESWDLVDPETNITLGAKYLSELIRRLDGKAMPALFAYNAGITRVRAWQSGAKDLPGDVFLESLPFAETREYGRKVLAAAAVYGYLYYQKSPGQIVRELF